MSMNDAQTDHRNEDTCPQNTDGHEPDWACVTVEHDGDGVYIDIPCKHCGRPGCVGTEKTLAKGICW